VASKLEDDKKKRGGGREEQELFQSLFEIFASLGVDRRIQRFSIYNPPAFPRRLEAASPGG
jgi:hypothetical protein